MSMVKARTNSVRGPYGRQTEHVAWGPIEAGQECEAYDLATSASGMIDSLQIEGDFKDGSSCRIMGSIDGENWRPLHNAIGLEATLSGPGIVGIMEAVRMIRPEFNGAGKIHVTAYSRGISQ